jgi:polysaccharide export outer membrane protein
MTAISNRILGLSFLLLTGLVAFMVTGCQSSPSSGDGSGSINPDQAYVFPGETDPANQTGVNSSPAVNPPPNVIPPGETQFVQSAMLRVGEKITVTFAGLPPPSLPPHEQRIRADGFITLPYGVKLQAAGKTPGQLEDDILKAYVPSIYVRFTPIVKAEERSFSVGGEVKFPNRQRYEDRTTVLRAIQSAGDFTDFANRKKIELIRANGEKFTVNWYEAKEDQKKDLEVFPGDQIIVRDRFF